ncbi:enoyl-CoA hydratase/isomerase family protein [Shewanella acanthi]|uniref:enoyl-CoA hydratase/isomerase family protein n=1 Tax=Shewanella acanthi TaxID=2864212 RepID=UPI001C6599A1|nr:enoyl-CoA hydratase/isomerase family protein [Shewanella acanthi]QYJ77773.1 enoyl-CoA hydratase/isomerase family protein [Shewanella acanthi]
MTNHLETSHIESSQIDPNVTSTATPKVVFQTLATASGKFVGIATLNVEKALNALDLDMVRALSVQLSAWKKDSKIACLVLDGSGEKAFCAGGDVRALYHASVAAKGEVTEVAKVFFEEEYRLDYLLHTFGKPVLVWGDGIVMGGGLGLMAGASHKVVTESSRIAMPEVTIGLYPDVGGSYFLNRMPGKMGLFLGLTAYQMNAADARYVGLADHYLNRDDKELMFDAMATLDWSDSPALNHQRLDGMINELSNRVQIPKGESLLAENQELIDKLMAGSLEDIVARMQHLDTTEKWLLKARDTLLAGSPISWHLVYRQAQLGTKFNLADCFKWELTLSTNTCASGDFCEGVRALLIDKDRQPKWQFADVKSVPDALVEQLLTSPWEEHPLHTLA